MASLEPQCPDENLFAQRIQGGLSEEQAQALDAHVAECGQCAGLVADLGRLYAPSTADGQQSGDPQPVARGGRLGRYVVGRIIGAGGMGVVYAGYDPELDRRVALKVLRTGADAPRSSAARVRMLREAQATARLTHPNVITVHDVSTIGEQVFLAMELVEGKTAREWIAAASRSVPEILDLYTKAGRGLAAAHGAGIVHRDVKPDNILIDDGDGRVLVTDFGLARAEASTRQELETGSAAAPLQSLTRTGAVVGTPRYMSPEQHRNEATDHRSDQFSLCVALYEAIYGVAPFEGESLAALCYAVMQGEPPSPPHRRDVVPWVRAAILRGLATDRTARHADMNALLAELERPRRSRRLAWTGLAALAATVTTLVAVGRDDVPCTGAPARVEEVWSARRAGELREAFAATGRGYAESAAARVSARLDAWTRTWAAAHTDACEATAVRQEQSAELLDLRMRCLGRQLRRLDALVAALATGGADAVDNAISAAAELPDVPACADAARLREAIPLPDDPEARAAIAALQSQLDAAEAEAKTGRTEAVLERAARALARAEHLDYPPVVAQAALLKGTLQAGTESQAAVETLFVAARAASLSRDDATLAQAWLALISAQRGLARYELALDRGRLAGFAIERSGHDPSLHARRAMELANVHSERAELDEALELFDEAAAWLERDADPNELMVARLHSNRGAALLRAGRKAEAQAQLRSALEVRRRVLGRVHPSTADTLQKLAIAAKHLSRFDEAVALYEEAREIYLATVGPLDRSVIAVEHNLGLVRFAQGDLARARAAFERAAEMAEQGLGPDHPMHATALASLGMALRRAGDYEGSRQVGRQALAIHEAVHGAEHPTVVSDLGHLATVALLMDDAPEAERVFRRALAIAKKVVPDDTRRHAQLMGDLSQTLSILKRPDEALDYAEQADRMLAGSDMPDGAARANLAVRIADALAELGRHRDAIPHLERSIAIRTRRPGDPAFLRGTRYSLIEALWGAGERARARAMAGELAAELRSAAPDATDEHERLDRWLAAHGRR